MSEQGDVTLSAPAPHPVDRRGDREEAAVVADPSRVVRLAAMAHVLLREVNSIELDAVARERLAEIHARTVAALGELLSPDLQQEMLRLGMGEAHGDGPTTTAELQVAQAQLVGWLDGLFQGIRASLATQQLEQQEQLARMYAESLQSKRAWEDERQTGNYL
jgi:hypothetical protein